MSQGGPLKKSWLFLDLPSTRNRIAMGKQNRINRQQSNSDLQKTHRNRNLRSLIMRIDPSNQSMQKRNRKSGLCLKCTKLRQRWQDITKTVQSAYFLFIITCRSLEVKLPTYGQMQQQWEESERISRKNIKNCTQLWRLWRVSKSES